MPFSSEYLETSLRSPDIIASTVALALSSPCISPHGYLAPTTRVKTSKPQAQQLHEYNLSLRQFFSFAWLCDFRRARWISEMSWCENQQIPNTKTTPTTPRPAPQACSGSLECSIGKGTTNVTSAKSASNAPYFARCPCWKPKRMHRIPPVPVVFFFGPGPRCNEKLLRQSNLAFAF